MMPRDLSAPTAHVQDRSRRDAYNDSSVSSSPSTSSATSDDVFSNGDARSSQSSAPSSVKGSPLTYDSEGPYNESYSSSRELEQSLSQTSINQPVAAELRRNPRRTSCKPELADDNQQDAGKKPVPSLIRQCDRKEQFVEALVDTTTEMIEVIWPLSVAQCSMPSGAKNILGLRKFVQEVLRRSKTSYSTLQVALFYIVLLIPFVPRPDATERREDAQVCRALRCGRRMFLAALILASKYLQDRNYTMQAWAKISGLKKEEICFNELAFLRIVNYDLHIPEQLFKDWADIVLKYSLEDECRRARALNGGRCARWRAIVPRLTRDLSAVSNLDADAFFQLEGSAWAQQQQQQQQSSQGRSWTPPASPVSSSAPSRSESPHEGSGMARPPQPPQLPRFLEPKALTTAEMALWSPKPSKLETPCLPPIGLECTPAASGNRCPQLAGSSMGSAMAQAGAIFINRACTEGFPMAQRVAGLPCSRRPYPSSLNSTPVQADVCDTATWRRKPAAVAAGLPAKTTSYRARESCLRAACSAEPTCDEVAFAARALQDISRTSSAYPTPRSMENMPDASSIVSDGDEISTPKVFDAAERPIVRPARKRERPNSPRDGEGKGESLPLTIPSLAGVVKHAGGIPVDYGAGIDDVFGRSRHMRSASGSCGGARKRSCLVDSNMTTSG